MISRRNGLANVRSKFDVEYRAFLSIDPSVAPLADVEIHRYPWRRSQHLEVPDSNQKEKESSYTYPVDIRLDRISRHMWWKRLLGRVARVKVYQGPITSA